MRYFFWFALALMLGLQAISAQAFRLQFKDPVGAERVFKTTLTMKGTADVLGMSMPLESAVTMTSIEKVLGKNANGTARISYTVTDGKVSATVTVPGADEDERIQQALPEFGMLYTRAASGKVTDVKTTGQLDAALKAQLDSLNSQMQYPGEGLVFPDREVKVGDRWEGVQTFQLADGSSMKYTVIYTITGTKVVGGKTWLVFSNDINARVNNLKMKTPAGSAMPSVNLLISMTITGKQTSLFDPLAGEMGTTAYNLHVDMKMTSDGAEALSMTMKMDMTGEMARQ